MRYETPHHYHQIITPAKIFKLYNTITNYAGQLFLYPKRWNLSENYTIE